MIRSANEHPYVGSHKHQHPECPKDNTKQNPDHGTPKMNSVCFLLCQKMWVDTSLLVVKTIVLILTMFAVFWAPLEIV